MLLNPYRFAGSSSGDDPYWANVLALLNGASQEGIVDAKGRSLTRTGTHSLITTDPDFPAGGIYFDGSSANNIRYSGTVSDWITFSGDFTIEFDFKPISKPSGYPCIIGAYTTYSTANNGFAFFDRHAGAASSLTYAYKGVFPYLSSAALTTGVRSSVQLSRSGSTIRLFVNGVITQSKASTGTIAAHNNFFAIGANGDNNYTYINGVFAKLRITQGVARNTANYTPSNAPFPIT